MPRHRPSRVLYLYRVKEHTACKELGVSVHELLDCLDGSLSLSGVVVVATANDPMQLDPAILKRPGRFDWLISSPNPSLGSRIEYLRRLLRGTIEENVLEQAAIRADRLSFAQIREAYIVASQAAFLRGAAVNAEALNEGIDRVRGEASGVSVRPDGRSVGFQGLSGHADRVTGPVNHE